ncbi:TetR/AcrR family transcriptional regulator [Conexibacter sp. SYSU D00693]|uniref:TetR/AcrR family transcriptional regulator n=1 Tax=Conexibacter sp. SYSU D00693 TaxID=2812560 RepID=UPI00196B6C18|nr:TetR family transcriptional regulator [Conexibacter sp. SYSU D00693]
MSEGPRRRDAERSRQALLDAAEELFAARGFAGASVAEIGAAAGLSREAPRYFFGRKEALYAAVLTRLFEAREAALAPAVAPLRAWAAGDDERPLEAPLAEAAEGYLRFLAGRPAFVSLVQREALEGGARLAAAPHESTTLEDVLRAVRDAAPRDGLARFDVAEAVVAWVALSVLPLAHQHTLLPAVGLDAGDPAFLARRRDQVVIALAALLRTA